MIVLAADVGATNARFALVEIEGARTEVREERVFPSARHAGLEEILHEFVRGCTAAPRAACLGVPGPVREGRARITNLPWAVEESSLGRAMGGVPLVLINDVEAAGWGVPLLGPTETDPLVAGSRSVLRSALLVAAGTGLGVSLLGEVAGELRPRASEGGHMAFAAFDARTRRLQGWLQERFGRASWERVVSGPGLVNVYRFLLEDDDTRLEPGADVVGSLDDELRAPAVVADAAIGGRCPVAGEALRLVARSWGAFAGDLALASLPDAVYLAGGLAPRLLPELRRGAFELAFKDKGRMAALIEDVPVHVALGDGLGLRGAARRAALLVGKVPR